MSMQARHDVGSSLSTVKAVGALMRSPDIMTDVEVVSELAAITEEHCEHDIAITPELIRKVTCNTWFESSENIRHYIIIDTRVRVAISCRLGQGNWIPIALVLVIGEQSVVSELKSTMKSNVIALRVLASNVPAMSRMFSFIIDKAPPGGIIMVPGKPKVRKKPPTYTKHKYGPQ